jgi:2-polyprenyl-6-methoxyphenol hydroxylase-like FAD-dependent oxidoreductase
VSGHRAVVVGAGLAGLAAARVLAEHVDEVVVVERDPLPEDASSRPGTPQGRHLHNLLLRGLHELEQMLPGLTQELRAAGAVPVDLTHDLWMRGLFGWFPRHPSDLTMLCCSRPLLEQVVRRRVRALPRIRWLDGHEVRGLDVERGRVAGVRCRPRGARDGGSAEEVCIEASMVVDAAGRGSRLPQWLEGSFGSRPEETVVNAFLGYSTRLYRPPATLPDWTALVVRDPLPARRGGAIMPREGGVWGVTLFGFGGDYPPTDAAGFDAFARGLYGPEFGAALRDAEPLSAAAGFRQTACRWRHFERLTNVPEGYVALGDTVCTFNPLYGQGMTVAVLGAAALGRLLAERGPGPGLGAALRQRVAELLAVPWRMATGEDYRYEGTEGPPRTTALRISHAYGDRVARAAMRDPVVHYRWLRVVNLLDPPRTLLAPRVLRQALVA